MSLRLDPRRIAMSLAAPLLAIAFSMLVTSVVLWAAGDPVIQTWEIIFSAWETPRVLTQVVNGAITLYLAALAVAIGFRMNLFNIGVDGQYRVAVFAAAVVGGEATFLPRGVNVVAMVLVAMAAGALWAAIAGLLKVYRGVSEVISTIMLNSIATLLIAFLLRKVAVDVAGSNNIGTKPLPESARLGGLALIPDSRLEVYGFLVVTILVGLAYWFVLGRTRFGFDLRATGRSEPAAVASGVNVKRMVLLSMVLSGAVAGLVGLPILLGEAYSYSTTFQSGLGFSGIAVALLGRNHPIGIALGALLFAYLSTAANPLQIQAGVAIQIVQIMQGIIVLSVVVAYEVVRRWSIGQEQRRVARELARISPAGEREQVSA
jgi:ABC-type uncharacterized transport system permease subunit